MFAARNLSSTTKLALGWLAAIAVALALLQWGIATISQQQRMKQTREELAQLQARLEKFRARHGQYPAVMGGVPLLQCLLGRADANGQPIKQQPWFMTGARLYFRTSDFDQPGNEIVDPWGRPYVYRPVLSAQMSSYVLASGGPGRRHSNPLLWRPGENGTAPEDADNLWVTPQATQP